MNDDTPEAHELQIRITGINLSDEKLRAYVIQDVAQVMCQAQGLDPTDAVKMLLRAAARVALRCLKETSTAEAMEKAFVSTIPRAFREVAAWIAEDAAATAEEAEGDAPPSVH